MNIKIPYEGPRFAPSCPTCRRKDMEILELKRKLASMVAWKDAALELAKEIIEDLPE